MTNGKKYNSLIKILDLIIKTNSISRIDLAKAIGLTRAAIGQLVEELIKSGLVIECGAAAPRGGRPPILLSPNPEAIYIIGAAVFNYSWSVILSDLTGNITDQMILPIERGSFENAVNTLVEGIEKIKSRNSDKSISPHFGIGSPGLVNSEDGSIISAIDLKWEDVNFHDSLRGKTEMIPVVANRSKVSALTSYYLNNPESYGNIISIVIGTGVASGFILNHKLYTGSRSGAGELGHTTVDPNGPACECGNRGCLQALVGEQAILERAVNHARKNAYPVPESIEDVFRDRGEENRYIHIIEEVAEYLAVAMGNLINIFNPDLIALSGPVITGCPELLDLIRKRTYHRCMKYNFESVQIISSEWGINTAAIGSTLLVRENIAEVLLS